MSTNSLSTTTGTYSKLMNLDKTASDKRKNTRSTTDASVGASGHRVMTPSPDPSSDGRAGASDNDTKESATISNQIAVPSTSPPTPVKRQLQRRSFEFYADQLEKVNAIWLKGQVTNTPISKSQIVRDAMDEYLRQFESTNADEQPQ